MSKKYLFLLVIIVFVAVFSATYAASRRPVAAWNYYHFDGSAFKPGPAVGGSVFIAVREKVRPVILTTVAQNEQVALPDGEGAVAGICYLQSSGGKLGNGSRFIPYAHALLLISAGPKQLVTVRTDDQGYFVLSLPAGTYTISSGPFTAGIIVEQGITTLVPLRAGKRMVD